MPYSLLFSTPQGLLMPLIEEPKLVGENYELSTAMWDEVEDIKDLFDKLQYELNETIGPKIWDIAARLVYLHPLIIQFDNSEATRRYVTANPAIIVQLHNSFDLPEHCVQVDESMRELTHTDMLDLILKRFKRQAIRRGI